MQDIYMKLFNKLLVLRKKLDLYNINYDSSYIDSLTINQTISSNTVNNLYIIFQKWKKLLINTKNNKNNIIDNSLSLYNNIKNIQYLRPKNKNIYITEKHGITYIFPLLLMKYGFFGSSENFINKALYSYVAKKVINKANKKFKNNKECKKKIEKFINEHNFTLEQKNEIKNKDLIITNYTNLNDFFIRDINMNYRNNIMKNNILYSPADCRCRFIKCINNIKINIKGLDVSLKEIGFDNMIRCNYIMLCRLIPSDYHKFHSPITGKIIKITNIKSNINFSVNEMVLPEFNPYTLNTRRIIQIETLYKNIIEICFVGATFISDIKLLPKIGSIIQAGEIIGWFKFGSCIILKLNNIQLNEIEIGNEYYAQVKDNIGIVNQF